MSDRNPLTDPKRGDVVQRALSTTPITVWASGDQVEYCFTGSGQRGHLRAMSLESWREWLQGGRVIHREESES